MFKILALITVVTAVTILLAPHLIPILSWVLAFFILLMAAVLIRSGVRRRRGESKPA
jgi:hypothetical protein